MEKLFVCSLFLLLVLVALDFSCADSKVNDGANTSLDPIVNETIILKANDGKGSNLDENSTSNDKVNGKLGDQVSGSGEQLGLKEDTKTEDAQNGESEKVKSDDGTKSKQVSETRGNEGCGSSDKCSDEENKFVGCLRVPGDDSADGSVLSLLIQNNGKIPLSIAISAPNFVNLETSKVLLEGKSDTKVKVSVREKGTDSLITLKSGNGQCSLDFKNLYTHGSSEESSSDSHKLAYSNIISRKSTIVFLFFVLLLIIASGWMCFSFRHKKASNYERLDMELPVSGVGPTNDGWDDSWGDDWEDEEAPSLPVTPSVSSKGLAARRLNKDGWKD